MAHITKNFLHDDLKPENDSQKLLQNKIKGFVDMAIECYNKHRPLYIDPKVIWVTIVHQVYLLITYNSEKLRHKYVNFQGKKDIELIRGDIDLDAIALEFANKIDDIIIDKDFKKWICTKFSTSDNGDEVVLSIMMMGIFKNYFNYMVTLCGIPEINILGTLQDWELLKQNLSNILDFECLEEYKIKKWHDDLNNLIDNFISAKQNTIDKDYWKNFVVGYHPFGSGALPYIKGHCIILNKFIVRCGNLVENCSDRLKFKDVCSEYTKCELKINDKPYMLKSGNITCVELQDKGLP